MNSDDRIPEADSIDVFGVQIDSPITGDGDGVHLATGVLVIVAGLDQDGQNRWAYTSNGMTTTEKIGYLTQTLDRFRRASVDEWTGD